MLYEVITGDPREDLGWMVTMDTLSNTSIMSHPADEARLAALEAALSRDRKLRALSAATGVDGAEIDLARIARNNFV